MKQLYIICFLFTHIIFCKSLNVLFVTGKFPYQPRQYIDNQIAGFIDAGVNVHVLAEEGSLYEEYDLAKKYKFKDITFYNDLPKDQRSYDIIYCQFSYLGKKMLQMKKEGLIDAKIVTCVRSGSEFKDIEKDIAEWKVFFQEVDLILSVCEVFKKLLIEYGCPDEKIVVHHSAIDITQFKYKEKPINRDAVKIVTVGRLMKQKGHQYVIEAIKNLKIKYPTIVYYIYGNGNMYNDLNNMIKVNNLENNVFLKGYCNHDVLQDELEKSDIFVLASLGIGLGKEGIPNVLMEAMAKGLLVIGTYHSGIPELIENNISGLLVPESDSVTLTNKIDYLIEHPELWKPFRKAARKKVVKEHCKEKQNKKLLKMFMFLAEDNNEK